MFDFFFTVWMLSVWIAPGFLNILEPSSSCYNSLKCFHMLIATVCDNHRVSKTVQSVINNNLKETNKGDLYSGQCTLIDRYARLMCIDEYFVFIYISVYNGKLICI